MRYFNWEAVNLNPPIEINHLGKDTCHADFFCQPLFFILSHQMNKSCCTSSWDWRYIYFFLVCQIFEVAYQYHCVKMLLRQWVMSWRRNIIYCSYGLGVFKGEGEGAHKYYTTNNNKFYIILQVRYEWVMCTYNSSLSCKDRNVISDRNTSVEYIIY